MCYFHINVFIETLSMHTINEVKMTEINKTDIAYMLILLKERMLSCRKSVKESVHDNNVIFLSYYIIDDALSLLEDIQRKF